MDTLSIYRDELPPEERAWLLQKQDGLAISIYLPVNPKAGNKTQNPLRLRQLLREAQDRLLDNRLDAATAQAWLDPIYQLNESVSLWSEMGHGLGLLITQGVCHVYHLPFACPEMIVIGNHFHIRPLLPLLEDEDRFCVLALSQNQVRLFAGSRLHLEEITIYNATTNIAEALRYDEFERQIQVHSSGRASGAGGDAPAMVHGQGSSGDKAVTKKYLQRFLKELDRGICELLEGHQEPLVLVGVDSITALYRHVSHYPSVLPVGVDGNPEQLSERQLHEATWPLIENERHKKFVALQRHVQDLLNQGDRHAMADVDNVLIAATQGRVSTLLVAHNHADWGLFDAEQGRIEPIIATHAGAEDLVNLTAIFTLRNRGTVYTLDEKEMLPGAPLTALLRY